MFSSNLRYLAALLPLVAAVLFLGNSGGPAASGNFKTGAPSAGGGTEQTCSQCHSSGNFGEPVINVSFEQDGMPVELTQYTPGVTYRVTVAVGYGSTAPAAYGFSSQFLNIANSPATPAGVPSNPNTGTRISNSTAGRMYIEQSTPSIDSTFSFDWTAPEAGGGTVSYYVVGNLVNRAAGTGGDNGSTSPTIITLEEGAPSSNRNFTRIPYTLSPNPTNGPANLSVALPSRGDYSLSVFALNGQEVSHQTMDLAAGNATIQISTEHLKAGMYVVRLTGSDSHLTSRLVVR